MWQVQTHTHAKWCIHSDVDMFTPFYKYDLHMVLQYVLFHLMIYLESLILYIHTLFLEGYLRASSVLLVGRGNW